MHCSHVRRCYYFRTARERQICIYHRPATGGGPACMQMYLKTFNRLMEGTLMYLMEHFFLLIFQ